MSDIGEQRAADKKLITSVMALCKENLPPGRGTWRSRVAGSTFHLNLLSMKLRRESHASQGEKCFMRWRRSFSKSEEDMPGIGENDEAKM